MDGIRYGPPLKLYHLCINEIIAVDETSLCQRDFRLLPSTALSDLYERLYQERKLWVIYKGFNELDIFSRLLQVKGKSTFLISSYQTLLNHGSTVTDTLLQTFKEYVLMETMSLRVLIDTGLKMGSFLNDGGELTTEILKILLECYKLKLYAESHYCKFTAAKDTYKAAHEVIQKLQDLKAVPHLSVIYANFSMYHFLCSEYNESYKWAQKSISLLSNDLTKREIIEVLRQASKSCVVKREFLQGGLLIRQAMNLGEILYNKDQLPTFSNVLMDYGFYLLNSDSIGESVYVYERALNMRNSLFDRNNILIALGHEDLAYALYVNEYSSGHFQSAKKHAEMSIDMMELLLPKDHLMLASVKRVKALILEEMALDERVNDKLKRDLLNTAELLHISALKLSRDNFGEKNVQTAKHYGNLGRLYQSMKQFDEAERMHLKAIKIKEELLGPHDYEVGLSVGHLASLYNYHMKKHKEAELLYIRSIEINIKLFGSSYSGLEYDYRGLIHVYTQLSDPYKIYEYVPKFKSNDSESEWEVEKWMFITISQKSSPKKFAFYITYMKNRLLIKIKYCSNWNFTLFTQFKYYWIL
ncbi:hypothetical protein GWI33_007761 [Rhynchophorus ferrugineus]|uniref:Amyloid protein-binding protein 2 n=1 Tax=Rhynchophorus ferrugineus TaxID=354439 RepID=A0A834IT99_RHYFE|nr:hypothetical protein GWI33_007761 [Rhynchophorus ferrugineus]